MALKIKKAFRQGYTLAEMAISLGIIGVLTAALLIGYGQNTKVERFSSVVREFAAAIREAQVRGYTVNAGECLGASGTLCYWRGTVLEYRQGDQPSYDLRLLAGQDYAEIPSRSQTRGITRKTSPERVYPLASRGVRITTICTNENDLDPVCDTGVTRPELSLAFLSPDGKAQVGWRIADAAAFNSGWGEPYPESERQPVKFILEDAATNLRGVVVFVPRTGIIDVRVE